MSTILRHYHEAFSTPGFPLSATLSLVAFVLSMVVNFLAINSATEHASSRVADLILSNIPVFEVDGLFIWGTAAVVLFSIAVVFPWPKRIPFIFFGVSLFIIIRSAFTLLTHLGAPEAFYASDFGSTINQTFFGADQFFSAHTGMPFLGVFAFWKQKKIRYTFLAISIYFAAVVLLGHIHYSIDVASAFFISYGIHQLAVWLFPKSRKLFLEAN